MQEFYKFITCRFVLLNDFRAPSRPSSGVYNCARNIFSDTKRQVINLKNCCIWFVNLFELYDDARTCQRQTQVFVS